MSATQSTTRTALTGSWGGPAPAPPHHLYVGIDVGRRHHQVAAIPLERMANGSWEKAAARKFATSGAGFKDLAQWLGGSGLEPAMIAIGCEPTGGWYSRTVAAWLERQGYEINWLQNWALHEQRNLAIGKQTKTDALDARLIARLLYERDLGVRRRGFLSRPPRDGQALRLLVRDRVRLVQQRNRYRVQLNAIVDVIFPELKEFFRDSVTGPAARLLLETLPTPDHVAAVAEEELYSLLVIQGRAGRLAPRLHDLRLYAADSAGLVIDIEPILRAQSWLLRQLRMVDVEIREVEKAIIEALETWPVQQRAIMSSFPGMSQQRQAVVLAAVGDFTAFRDDRQLRKLLGWYPELRESGTSLSGHHLGHSGIRLARREIWLWCIQLLSPSSHSPFRLYYERLRNRGMSGQVAVGHLAGKLISVLFYCVRREQPYDPERHARELGLELVG
jgi:transposase